MGVLVRHTQRKMIRKGVAGFIGGLVVTGVTVVYSWVSNEPDAKVIELIAEPLTAAIATIVASLAVYFTKSSKEDLEHNQDD